MNLIEKHSSRGDTRDKQLVNKIAKKRYTGLKNNIRPGQIWGLAWKDNNEPSGYKVRPVVVLVDRGDKVYIAEITTHEARKNENEENNLIYSGDEIEIPPYNARKLRLLKPSTIRLTQQAIVPKRCLIKLYTTLDQDTVDYMLLELQELVKNNKQFIDLYKYKATKNIFIPEIKKVKNGIYEESFLLEDIEEDNDKVSLDSFLTQQKKKLNDIDSANKITKAKSNGIYSIYNGWIKKPVQKDIPDIDMEEFEKRFKIWEDKYFDLLDKINGKSLKENIDKDVYDLLPDLIDNLMAKFQTNVLTSDQIRNDDSSSGYLGINIEDSKELVNVLNNLGYKTEWIQKPFSFKVYKYYGRH